MVTKPAPDPLSNRATGLWFKTPAGTAQRYEALPYPHTGHWYLDDDKQWHVYHEWQVKPIKQKGATK